MPRALSIPSSWNDVTPAWLETALADAFPGCRVDKVELVLVDDGTNRRARFAVIYGAGDGPASLFFKAADPEHAALNAATGGLFNEARLFASGVDLPIEVPATYLSLVDEENLDFLLVMEDVVARGCDPRDATRPLTIEQATNGARALARLHSTFVGDRLDAPELAWLEPFMATYRLARGIDMGKKAVGDVLPAEVEELDGADVDAIWHRFTPSVLTGPQTLIHGDAHIGNTYLRPDDEVGFLDWQVVHSGNGTIDLAYFVQGALTVEDRRVAERGIVSAYVDALAMADTPSVDEVWLRYRAAASYGMALWLATAASTWQRSEVSAALAERYARAFVDLDCARAVDELA